MISQLPPPHPYYKNMAKNRACFFLFELKPMECSSIRRAPPLSYYSKPSLPTKPTYHISFLTPKHHAVHSLTYPRPTHLHATLRKPRGFGNPEYKPKKKNKKQKQKRFKYDEDDDDEDKDEDNDDGDYDEAEEGIIPEIVTNRMISRMGFTVGLPLFTGLAFFPFFYYLKVGLIKIDVPTWVPFIVSFFFFGSALLGISYGIVSTIWDPLREGSLLGWQEAQKNWPVFLESFRNGGQSARRK